MIDIDLWEYSYIKNLPNSHLVCWDDTTAKFMNPKHSWVYNKLFLAKKVSDLSRSNFKISNKAKVETWDLSKEFPNLYPVVVKPIENLEGLSKNVYVASSFDEIEDFNGFIAQECLNGIQYTTDMLINKGEIVDYFSFITEKNFYGEIKLFYSTPFLSKTVRQVVQCILKGYSGVCNVEYIDDKIIEMHLRPSLQFYDISGGFLSRLPEFYKSGSYQKSKFEQTYSRVFRTRFDGNPEVLKLPSQPKEIRSVQFTWEDGYRLSETDPSLFRKRYMVINGIDLSVIENYAKEIKIRL